MSRRGRTALAGSCAGAWLAVVAAAPAVRAQSDDFFEQRDDYFRAESIEGVSKHREALAETPATVTVIDREDIERYGFRTIADVLNFASVGSFTHSDRRYDFAGSRGLFFFEDFNTRVLVMLNGHPLNEPWNNFGGVGREMVVPLELADRIEIVYGPSSLLYGGYSLYGIVNVVTRNGESAPGARARLTGGSWGTGEGLLSYGRSFTSGSSDWNVLAAAGYYRSSGEDLDLPRVEVDYPATPAGEPVWGGAQSGTDFERAPFGFLYAKRGGLSLLVRSGYRRHGAPLAPYDSVYGSTREFVKDTKHFGEVRWDRKLSAHASLTARAFHDEYTYEEHDPYFDDESYPGASAYDFVLHTDARDSGAELRLHVQEAAHSFTVGGEYRARGMSQRTSYRFLDGSPAPGSLREARVTGHLAVAYVQEQWRPRDALTLVAGANVADTRPGGRRVQPRAAVIWKPRSNLSLKGLYDEGFRPPSIFEASYTDFDVQIGNPALSSERMRSGELSLVFRPAPKVSTQAYAFTSKLVGLIQGVEISDVSQVQGGVLPPDGNPEELVGVLQYQSRGDVTSSGAGLALRVRASSRFRCYANLAYAHARLSQRGAETKTALPASSSWLGSAGVSYDVPRWTASIAARYVGPHELEPSRGLSRRAGDFVVANLRLSWKTRVVYPLRVDLDVLNVFDERGGLAASPVYTPSTVPVPGRQVLLSADVRF